MIKTWVDSEETCRVCSSNNRTWTSTTNHLKMETSLGISLTIAWPITAMVLLMTPRLAQFSPTISPCTFPTLESQVRHQLLISLETTLCPTSRTNPTSCPNSQISTYQEKPLLRPPQVLTWLEELHLMMSSDHEKVVFDIEKVKWLHLYLTLRWQYSSRIHYYLFKCSKINLMMY